MSIHEAWMGRELKKVGGEVGGTPLWRAAWGAVRWPVVVLVPPGFDQDLRLGGMLKTCRSSDSSRSLTLKDFAELFS